MSENESPNRILIELKGNSTETKLINAVDRLAVVIDKLCDADEERMRICSYAINRFADLKNSSTRYTF